MRAARTPPWGIGVDIERIARFRLDRQRKKTFLQKIYTKRELAYCFSKKDPAPHLAARFAAKEAVYKALSGAHLKLVAYPDMEILSDVSGAPRVAFLQKRPPRATVAVSLSHSADDAIAVAVVVRR